MGSLLLHRKYLSLIHRWRKIMLLMPAWMNFFIQVNLHRYELWWDSICFISTFHWLKSPLMSVMHVNLTYCIQPCFPKLAVPCDSDNKNAFSDKKVAAQNKEFPPQRVISWKGGNTPGQKKPGNRVSCSFLKPPQEVAQIQPYSGSDTIF